MATGGHKVFGHDHLRFICAAPEVPRHIFVGWLLDKVTSPPHLDASQPSLSGRHLLPFDLALAVQARHD